MQKLYVREYLKKQSSQQYKGTGHACDFKILNLVLISSHKSLSVLKS